MKKDVFTIAFALVIVMLAFLVIERFKSREIVWTTELKHNQKYHSKTVEYGYRKDGTVVWRMYDKGSPKMENNLISKNPKPLGYDYSTNAF